MTVPVVKCCTDDSRYVPTPSADRVVRCYHGNDPRRVNYGQVMTDVWLQYPNEAGMIWVEGDIAIEPLHVAEICDLLSNYNDCVIAVPFRLYPASTHQETVMWPFYVSVDGIRERILTANEPIPFVVRSFGLGCTYLPSRLFKVLGEKLRLWDWPSLDWRLSVAAREAGIMAVTTRTPALHMHY
jgi:hypothetical protein